MYGEQLTQVYEEIYQSRGKDWGAEARLAIDHIKARAPKADSLLDVACGTGAHLSEFSAAFRRVEGVDIEENMLRAAKARVPDVLLTQADMRDFDLGRRFDAVCCMFCSLAYLPTVEDMRAAVRTMADHLVPGGVIVIEPWWFPEKFIDGYVAGDLARGDDRTIARISHSVRKGDATHMEVRFLVGDSDGITEFTEIDVLTLFTEDEYLSALADAGCPAEYLPGAPTGRGLFIGVRN
ncbi:SAM-dependent methyltransferase [Nocardiopsis mwathae]|uniref:SAM-dependent methyltransferase n=1 Tax=Nocardiopsis mwathae TaxID=1472723 RepID=A0A7W9YEP0_9ACTN|nr:class I SAM-dependent methyltransferase [Nocardiopsis mwathae]MBB6170788.1 SAM-dependent methyltransferase [Nocardiopsis mwathae]